ncbi:hypothetical protein [Kingella kingae]|uniref:hypothetical protein n=1 Tax=Kingella kingae TaxID=504 RepID=UPI00254CA31A|nr:hypothetical protein [Kingella kingae]MDK4579309.1 hypothetical protein [Kingella kingae]
MLKECDAFRRPERVQAALNVCLADQQGRLGKQNSPYPQREHIMALIAAAQQINAGEIAQQYAKQPAQISEKIDEARAMQVKALQAAFREKMTEH